MHRVIAFLLLSFLSFQPVWAAVSSHAEHEKQHVAHHQLAQHAEADIGACASDAAGTESDSGEADCGHCHCSCAGFSQLLQLTSGGLPHVHPRPALDAASGAHASARPERPQWLHLA